MSELVVGTERPAFVGLWPAGSFLTIAWVTKIFFSIVSPVSPVLDRLDVGL
jgi:hypothetical protein